MVTYLGVALAVAVCLGVVMAVAAGRRTEWLLHMLFRAVMSMIAIYFINYYITQKGYDVIIGINHISFLTTAILGFPGLLALYGFRILQIL